MIAVRRRLVGLLACLLILGIIIGLPAVLLAVGVNPLSGGAPSLGEVLDALSSPDDGSFVIGLITIVGWLAWAILTLLIVFELLAAARGIRVPKLPGLRVPQNAARNLVSTALLLFVTVPLGAGIANASPTPPPPTTHAAPATPRVAPKAATPAATQHTSVRDSDDHIAAKKARAESKRTIEYTVKPGDTLWSIAKDKLGDGRQYREILKTNAGVLGGKANFIPVGLVLTVELPDDAGASSGDRHKARAADRQDSVVVEPGDTLSSIADDELGDADRYPEIFEASRDIKQPGGVRLTDPDVIDVGWTLSIPHDESEATRSESAERPTKTSRERAVSPEANTPPGTRQGEQPSTQPTARPSSTTPASPRSEPTGHATEQHADQTQDQLGDDQLQEEPDWMARTPYGVGAILAAGVVALIAARRRTQQRRRRPGQRLPTVPQRPAQVERELRATADQMSVEIVDVALRMLARDCAAAGSRMPQVRAARLTAQQFDLYLAEPAPLPPPWSGTADATVWTLEIDNTDFLNEIDVSEVTAPWPSLVTVGNDEEDGHVLLDLEHLGTLGVTGDPDTSRQVFAALAVELATSIWADDLQVTIVGNFPELEDTLQSGRIRYMPTVGRILEDLQSRATRDRQALAAEHLPDLGSARLSGRLPDAWIPEIVLISGGLTQRQRTQLEQVVDELPRVALAFVTAGAEAVGEWTLDLTPGEPDQAVLGPIGLRLAPQRIPAEQYADLLQIAALSHVDELEGRTDTDEPVPLAAVEPISTPDDLQPLRQDTTAVGLGAPQPAELPRGDRELGTVESETAPVSADANVQQTALLTTQPEAQTPDSTDDPVPPTAEPANDSSAAAAERESDQLVEPNLEPVLDSPTVPALQINVLGPVEILNATGKVEPSKRARLLEFAAYLALHAGATHTAIDNAIWPDRKNEDNLNTRNPATSKLRRWVGSDPEGREYLPRHQAGEGYAFLPEVTTDVQRWDDLMHGAPLRASTDELERGLELVRGIPFEGTHPRRYGWAESIKQRLISEIVDASYELGRRRLMSGRWRAAEQALVVGLRIEPAQENLWRLRIIAAHESRNPAAEAEAIERLLTITEQIDCELEPETEELIAALRQNPSGDLDHLMSTAL